MEPMSSQAGGGGWARRDGLDRKEPCSSERRLDKKCSPKAAPGQILVTCDQNGPAYGRGMTGFVPKQLLTRRRSAENRLIQRVAHFWAAMGPMRPGSDQI